MLPVADPAETPKARLAVRQLTSEKKERMV